ncbi:unnamed protein product [Prunus armeniaca]|uniref:Uncharacterized protein n=1 Tax=Prunus armeniaca TaxID=36596 RepID=A0A6J5V481_PRUAR|nr:unnamed protein product [Prunus armeniaca]
MSDKEPPLSAVRNALIREWCNSINVVDVKIAWSRPDISAITVTVVAADLQIVGVLLL